MFSLKSRVKFFELVNKCQSVGIICYTRYNSSLQNELMAGETQVLSENRLEVKPADVLFKKELSQMYKQYDKKHKVYFDLNSQGLANLLGVSVIERNRQVADKVYNPAQASA